MKEIDNAEASSYQTVAPVFKKRGLKVSTAASDRSLLSEKIEEVPGQSDAKLKEENSEEERVSLEDLFALRALRRNPVGIDLDRLNRGDVRKKKKKRKKDEGTSTPTEEDRWTEQMQKGGLMQRSVKDTIKGEGLNGDNEEDDDAEDEEAAKSQSGAPKLIKQNNFQGETGTIDVDKHMMAYIEEEMKRRKQKGEDAELSSMAKIAGSGILNSNDELYSVAEKYKKILESAREAMEEERKNVNPNAAQAEKDEKEEGNATLSSAMLNGVPEVDLGIDHRMKNIEETERAKRLMMEAQREKEQASNMEEDSDFASARFFKYGTKIQSDADIMRTAESFGYNGDGKGLDEASKRQLEHKKQTATDDVALERFKKRQRNQLKR